MCLFIGILFLVAFPVAILGGQTFADPVFMWMLWLGGLLAVAIRLRRWLSPAPVPPIPVVVVGHTTPAATAATPATAPMTDPAASLQALEAMRAAGHLTDEEYAAKRAEILGRL